VQQSNAPDARLERNLTWGRIARIKRIENESRRTIAHAEACSRDGESNVTFERFARSNHFHNQ
jgi:hypothetical protein